MNIKKEIMLPGNEYFDKEEKLSEQFLHISPYTLLESIPEMLSEWWASTQKDMHTFLEDNGLSKVIDDKTFTDILLGKYYFSDTFLVLLKEKIPYNISLEKLYWHNKSFIKKHSKAEQLKTDDDLVINLLKEIRAKKKEEKKKHLRAIRLMYKKKAAEASARYRSTHKEEIKESKKKYRQTHKKEIKAYRASRREKDNELQHKRYVANLEENRAKGRIYGKKRYQEHKGEILARQTEYRSQHREEINERRRKRMENEEYRFKARERYKAYYDQNSAEVKERRKQRRLQNIEEVRSQEKIYGKTYREKHREEIRARNRAHYREDLQNSREKSAERQRKYRNKKRFKTETSKMIMPLLSALVASKIDKDER